MTLIFYENLAVEVSEEEAEKLHLLNIIDDFHEVIAFEAWKTISVFKTVGTYIEQDDGSILFFEPDNRVIQ